MVVCLRFGIQFLEKVVTKENKIHNSGPFSVALRKLKEKGENVCNSYVGKMEQFDGLGGNAIDVITHANSKHQRRTEFGIYRRYIWTNMLKDKCNIQVPKPSFII